MKRKVKKKKLKIKNVFFALFVVAFFTLIATYLVKVPIRSYYIEGNEYYTDSEILEMTGLDKYPSFLFTNSITVSDKVKNNKFIKSIKIKKTPFLEFYVKVNERKVLFYDDINKKLVLEDGVEVDETDDDVPVLLNKVDDKKVYEKFLRKIGKINEETLNMISEITYEPNYIDKERFLVAMNDGNYVYLTLSKFQSINNYVKISKTLGEKNGILYLDYGNYFLSQ